MARASSQSGTEGGDIKMVWWLGLPMGLGALLGAIGSALVLTSLGFCGSPRLYLQAEFKELQAGLEHSMETQLRALRDELQVLVASGASCAKPSEVSEQSVLESKPSAASIGRDYHAAQDTAKPPDRAEAGAGAETQATVLPDLPQLDQLKKRIKSMLKDKPQKQALMQLYLQCKDISAGEFACDSREKYCNAADVNGRIVRAFCPRMCRVCAVLNANQHLQLEKAQDATAGRDLQKREVQDGTWPKATVSSVGWQKVPILVVDNFLPLSVVQQANLLAKESLLWQPAAMEHKGDWEPAVGGAGSTAPRDSRGLFAPAKLAGGFPGLQMPPCAEYMELFWARLQTLDLPKSLHHMLPRDKAQMRKSPVTAFHQMVCRSPSSLHFDQARPHVDKRRGEDALVIVHFFSNWSAGPSGSVSGGLGFYGERLNNGTHRFGQETCARLQAGAGSIFCGESLAHRCAHGQESQAACKGVKFTDRMRRNRTYISDAAADPDYELLEVVAPRFNRAVVYSAQQLHSAYIDQAALDALSCKAKDGRLFTSIFFGT